LYEPELAIADIEKSPENTWNLFVYNDGSFAAFAPLTQNLIFLLMGALFLIVGVIIFTKRDLPAPI
jgi:hypothetical protein